MIMDGWWWLMVDLWLVHDSFFIVQWFIAKLINDWLMFDCRLIGWLVTFYAWLMIDWWLIINWLMIDWVLIVNLLLIIQRWLIDAWLVVE